MTEEVPGGATTPSDTSASAAPAAASTDWISSLEPDHKALVTTKGYKTPNDVVKAYFHASKAMGADKIALPGKDAKPEDWRKVYSALGLPEKVEDYGLKAPEDFADYDQEFAGWFGKAAHELGLPKSLTVGLHDKWVETARQAMAAKHAQAERQEQELDKALRTEWGAAYDVNIAKAQKAVSALGLKEDIVGKLEGALGSSDLLKFFHTLGEKMGTDTLVGGASAGFAKSPAAAQAEITKLMGDPEFQKKHNDARHPEHQWSLDHMRDLHRMAETKA